MGACEAGELANVGLVGGDEGLLEGAQLADFFGDFDAGVGGGVGEGADAVAGDDVFVDG